MIIRITLLCILITVAARAGAQSIHQSVASRIAIKMKDSLSLSEAQKNLVFSVNMRLSTEKSQVWQQHSHADSIMKYVQRVENKRDSLYRPILTAAQFETYIDKKHILISNQ